MCHRECIATPSAHFRHLSETGYFKFYTMRNSTLSRIYAKIPTAVRRAAMLCCTCLMIAATGCSDDYDDSALRQDIEQIKDRVKKLEQQVTQLNTDYKSMQQIVNTLEGHIGIESVEPNGDGYTLRLSDGSTITINDNSSAEIPVICVKADDDGVYYWAQRTGDEIEWLLDDNGQKLPVSGVTPTIGVDAEGYWTVSYGNGAAVRLTDAEGNPILAEGDSALFKSVDSDDDNVYITLNDEQGTILTIAKSSAFSLTITDAPEVAEFEYGQTLTFAIEQKSVEKIVITKPDHWRAAISDNTLTVTAPTAEHAACAELQGEVAIIFFNAASLSKVTSLKVKVVKPKEPMTPMITVPSDFSGGYVQRAVYNDKKVAEICLELVRTADGSVEQQMVVIYPMSGDKADLSKGIDTATGGSVVWNSADNTVTYTAGSATAPIETFYVLDDGSLATECDKPSEAATVEPDLLVDIRGEERQSYRQVKIATQYWLADNLRAEYFADGTPISTDWTSETGAYIYFDENPTDWKSVYGTIYSGAAVLSQSGLAPEGWTIPAADDVTALKTYIGSTVTGTKLKSTIAWVKYPGSNLSGFDALPGGYYVPSNSVDQFGNGTPDTYFWTATELYDSLTRSNSIVYFRLYDLNTRLTFDPNPSSFAATMHAKTFGHYVRCLRK